MHIFYDNLPRNSCILKQNRPEKSATLNFNGQHSFGAVIFSVINILFFTVGALLLRLGHFEVAKLRAVRFIDVPQNKTLLPSRPHMM